MCCICLQNRFSLHAVASRTYANEKLLLNVYYFNDSIEEKPCQYLRRRKWKIHTKTVHLSIVISERLRDHLFRWKSLVNVSPPIEAVASCFYENCVFVPKNSNVLHSLHRRWFPCVQRYFADLFRRSFAVLLLWYWWQRFCPDYGYCRISGIPIHGQTNLLFPRSGIRNYGKFDCLDTTCQPW